MRAKSLLSLFACSSSPLRSGSLGSDIGLDLLDLCAKRLEDVLRDRVLARLHLALGALGRPALAARLEDGARAGLLRFGRVEEPDRDLHRLHLRHQLADERAE